MTIFTDCRYVVKNVNSIVEFDEKSEYELGFSLTLSQLYEKVERS
jgi:hypothetical protein